MLDKHQDYLTKVYIFKENILHNLKAYQDIYKDIKIAPVLKSNAYGHGLEEVALILDGQDVPFILLNSYEEAIILRSKGIVSKILVMGYVLPEYILKNNIKNISFVITSLEQLHSIRDMVSKVNIHLKVDTGMHRQGITYNQLSESIGIIQSNKFLNLEGVCSHLADADSNDQSFTKKQIEEWENVSSVLQKTFQGIQFFHISATAGMTHSKMFGNMARIGVGLYGIDSSPKGNVYLKPSLEVRSVVVSLKTVPKADYIGYNHTYQTKEAIKIAIVSAGYFEGVDRRLSNQGFFKVKNKACPIVGRVSMNMTVIEVTSVPSIQVGDEVTIVSGNDDDKNSVKNMARTAGTIPWEVLIHIPQHLPRIVI